MSKTTPISESLTTLRDEARVQLHLLSLDAQAQWRELEPKLSAFETNLKQGGGRLSETLAATERELAAKVKAFLKAHAPNKS